MNKKICYGILNYKRKLENSYFDIIPSKENMVVCTNNVFLYPQFTTIQADQSCSVSKNLILKYAISNKYDHCFIIEDDIKILDLNVFDMYIHLSEMYGSKMLFYGFHGNVNKNKLRCGIFNPSMIVKIDDTRTIFVNRNMCSGFTYFKISDKMTMYDERLKFFENEYLAYDMTINKEIPFNGFFIDIFESYKYFSRLDLPTVRIKNTKDAVDDLKLRERIKYHMDTSDFCNFIINKHLLSNVEGFLK